MPLNPRIPEWTGLRVWLVGASTGIGRATAIALHAAGAKVIVSARNVQALQTLVEAHPGMRAEALDVTDRLGVARVTRRLLAQGPLDVVCYCAGYYQAMRATAQDLDVLLQHQKVNYVGALHVLDAVLPAMRAHGKGHFSLVSSVAGFRGLPQSLAYGPTKAALINLAEAMYLDLHDQGLGVSVITPGFVDTPLTAHNDFTMPALTTPEAAAQAILSGWQRGEFGIHFPKRFTRVMKLLRLLPCSLYFPAVRRLTGL